MAVPTLDEIIEEHLVDLDQSVLGNVNAPTRLVDRNAQIPATVA
jgi:hypothetical protein